MHDLAILVVGLENITFGINGENIGEKTHYVSFGFNLSSSLKIPTLLFKANWMRTFLLPSQAWHPCQAIWNQSRVWNQSTCDTFVSSFKFLRMLDLNGTDASSVPHSIGKLKLLKYLDLSGKNYIKMLPNSITRLQNLETLNLSCCRGLIELPRNFTKLVDLRHLNIDGC